MRTTGTNAPLCVQAKEGGRAAVLACAGLGAWRQWRVHDVPFAASARTRGKKEGGGGNVPLGHLVRVREARFCAYVLCESTCVKSTFTLGRAN